MPDLPFETVLLGHGYNFCGVAGSRGGSPEGETGDSPLCREPGGPPAHERVADGMVLESEVMFTFQVGEEACSPSSPAPCPQPCANVSNVFTA